MRINHRALARTFQKLVCAAMPMPALVAAAGCGGSVVLTQHGDDSGADSGSSNDDASEDTTTTFVSSCGDIVTRSTSGPFGGSQCGVDRCFPLDAGALIEAGWDGGATIPGSQCLAICGSATSCTQQSTTGVALIRCSAGLCLGRRPDGLAPSETADAPLLGAFFVEMARLEAASVEAFRRLRRELFVHGAPRRLVRAAARAAQDETRHARMAAALARRYGGEPAAPFVEPRPVRGLEALALDNAVEGCAREAFGALVATWQAKTVRDPLIRRFLQRIAHDETRHAALAFELDVGLSSRLDAPTRGHVVQTRRDALRELSTTAPEWPQELRIKLGLPTRHETRTLVEALQQLAA
jgi:hypothetical protein